jgi:hypothetical protein
MLRRLGSVLFCVAIASFLSTGIRALHLRALSLEGASASGSLASVPVSYAVEGGKIDGVSLSLPADAPRRVKVKLSVDGTWYSCVTEGTAAHCSTPGLTLASVNVVEVAGA